MRLLQLACSCSSDQRPALACCRNLSCFRWHNAFASLCCGAGTWAGHELSVEGGSVVVETADREVRIPYTQAKTPAELDYNSLGVQQVWECTGVFLTRKALQPYFDKGVPKVVVSAPVKDAEDPVLNIVYGVNHVSCTDSSLVPRWCSWKHSIVAPTCHMSQHHEDRPQLLHSKTACVTEPGARCWK
eukprot:GHUV01046157.1.p1 GENE.GHUV01046157.1~~GHUV01046157.1.p1  ORF type:complete len:187 (-),score=26.32 GHUV01046157.1:843-1403(-)